VTYTHTQKGISGIALAALLVAVGATIVAAAPFVSKGGVLAWMPLMTVVLIGGAITVIFTRLTARVDEAEVRWAFGWGFPSYRLSLDEIESTEIVTYRVWSGYGIRIIPGGMLYNIAGNRAVEIIRRNKRKIRIGTDEPEALRAAIEAARQRIARAS
jgi:hypothetical protein